jgi:uncharacterized Zn finger protein (UPF0148 family)
MSSKNTKGKLRKVLDKECPECEIDNLQLREYQGRSIEICPSCGFEEEDEAFNKNNIRKSREMKNEELALRKEQARPNSSTSKRTETGFKKNR